MTVKNESNGAHRNTGQSGNSEFPIHDILPIGKTNSIDTATLVKIVGRKTPRDRQLMVAEERKRGAVILSSVTGRYFRLGNHNEIAEFCKALENRASNTLPALRSAKKELENIDGQEFQQIIPCCWRSK